jgi:ligand-binding SRPBCC domain-containing protein
MPTFDYSFTVDAPLQAVADFHHDTTVLKKLTPFPMVVQVHDFEPLGEGSRAEFTIWAGPVPMRWQAVHSDVSVNGFTDTQVSGPLKAWRHTHRFTDLGDGRTRVDEHIEFEHDGGARGLFSRAMFSPIGLTGLFTARKLLNQRYVAAAGAARAAEQS